MNLLQKLDLFTDEEISSGATTSANVEPNVAKGHIDIVGGKCPDGQVYDKLKKVCVPAAKNETSVSAAVAGSGQTRVWGERKRWMDDLDRKEPIVNKTGDLSKDNILGRPPTKFDPASGAYIPKLKKIMSQED